jgi:hypothetical protein
MLILRKLTLFVLFLLLGCAAVPSPDRAAQGSVLIGSLKGTLQEPPRPFVGNSPSIGGDRGSIEFRGFRVIRKDDGRNFLIRPLKDSFFYQELPSGTYDLVRKRLDRPSYREPGFITILTFTVPDRSLVDVGTIEITLVNPPESSNVRLHTRPRGTFTYTYRYERPVGSEENEAALNWFASIRPDTAAQFAGNTVKITSKPTEETDSSEFQLKDYWGPWFLYR